MAEDQAPPVVVVVVSSNPGPWLEESLAALVAQDYANLAILVVDAASETPIAARVASVAPQAYLHRLDENFGFGPSANCVLSLVQGSTHLLFCHDDTVMESDCVRRLVEEAFRSNAGVVAPKLVDYDEPDRILQLGLGVDRFGAPVRRVERLEFDQAQHDESREVFAVPGGAVLVRADLFAAIHGFDAEISMFGEDVDLCWRARLAGARVVVVPTATARHLEATASRKRPLQNARDLQWRHELRAVLKNYGQLRRVFVVAQLVILSGAEAAYFLCVGRRRRARQVFDAWKWNLAPQRHLRAARAEVLGYRRLRDRSVCALFTRRSFRLWRYLRPLLEETAHRWSQGGISHRVRPHTDRARSSRRVTALGVLAVVVVVFGSRSLIFGHLPLIGQYLPLPSPSVLLGHFFGGYDDAMTQRPGPASPAFLLLGLGGAIFFGATAVFFKVVLIVLIVLAARGAARLVAPYLSPAASVFAGIAYLFLPLCWDDLALGNVDGLIAFAAMPYLIARIARASQLTPYTPSATTSSGRRVLLEEILGLAILTALVGAFEPLVLIMVPILGVLVALGCALSNARSGGLRALAISASATFGAFILLFPWSITFVQRSTAWSVLTGAATSSLRAPQLGALLRFDVGPLGRGLLGWSFLVATLFVLIVARGERLAWGTRLWVLALGSGALVWAASEGWLGPGGGASEVLLAPFALAIAALIGIGVAAVRDDVTRVHFGWRHLSAIVFGVLVFGGSLPVLGASLGGRWSVPDSGYDVVLSWMSTNESSNTTRTLWLGDPAALPLESWQIKPGLALAVSQGGLPDAQRLFQSPNPGEARALVAAVEQVETGLTVRLGHLLASQGIRYVVVPTALAPVLAGTQAAPAAPPPQVLLDGLAAQSDLRQLPAEGGALVFEDATWKPNVGPDLVKGSTPAPLRSIAIAAQLLTWAVLGIYLARRRRIRREHRRARARATREPTTEATREDGDTSIPTIGSDTPVELVSQ